MHYLMSGEEGDFVVEMDPEKEQKHSWLGGPACKFQTSQASAQWAKDGKAANHG